MGKPLQEFIASMNKSGGFARTARYAVRIIPPANLVRLAEETSIAGPGSERDFGTTFDNPNAVNMLSLANQVGQQINLHCNSVSMPGHDLQAQDVQHGSAPGRQMVTSHDYAGTIAASFYLDSHLRERHFFEQWQKMAVSTTTHKANYYDDYIGTMEIFQLDGDGRITYGIKATEVYPTTIAGIEYGYANANTIATQAVNFQYRQWYNLTADTIAGYTASNSLFLDASRQREKLRQTANQLANKFIDSGAYYEPGTIERREKSRQKQLRKPSTLPPRESSRRAGITEAKRQEQLRPPNSK